MGKISYWSITMDLIPYLFMPLVFCSIHTQFTSTILSFENGAGGVGIF